MSTSSAPLSTCQPDILELDIQRRHATEGKAVATEQTLMLGPCQGLPGNAHHGWIDANRRHLGQIWPSEPLRCMAF